MEEKKDQQAILNKLSIEHLNKMQEDTEKAISSNKEVVLLSPTGTGKTLAFLLPVVAQLNPDYNQVQVLILVPSRELAIQIEQVAREMGSGYKINAVYGGRAGAKDKMDLKQPPAILIGTPGRVADHLRKFSFITGGIKTLILDEFDKSLEVGFEKEMKEIVEALPQVEQKILTSATQKAKIPGFMGLRNPKNLNYLTDEKSQLALKTVVSSGNKLETLADLIGHIGGGSGIVFCNYKDSIQDVSDYLNSMGINHGCFYGGLEQIDRERSLIKFRNGTHQILLATDLAARGIDVPEMDFIIHYEMPYKADEFTHRNGRTARMNSEGTAFIIKGKQEQLPEFIKGAELEKIEQGNIVKSSNWTTLYISGGRKDKISKGDVAGLFFKQGGLKKGELGVIELKQDCVFVAVPSKKANQLISELNNSRIKKRKVRISLLNN